MATTAEFFKELSSLIEKYSGEFLTEGEVRLLEKPVGLTPELVELPAIMKFGRL